MTEMALSPREGRVSFASTTRYLFLTFLKIGSCSFGGNMALVSMVERIVVYQDRRISREEFLRGIGLAAILPGPMAVNAVAYSGFVLGKWRGALLSFVAILLPAFCCMLLLSWIYFEHAEMLHIEKMLNYVIGVVAALITSVAWTMFRKEIADDKKKIGAFLICFIVICFIPGFLTTVMLIVVALIAGMFTVWFGIRKKNAISGRTRGMQGTHISLTASAAFILLIILQACFYLNVQSILSNIHLRIAFIFSGLSLSLFGGGYTIVPMMQSLFVGELQWLTDKEFVDAIALSQATPGPILVSATFMGYKVAGVSGAIIATVCVFGPSAVLTTLIGQVLGAVSNHKMLNTILMWPKVVVVAMIAGSVSTIVKTSNTDLPFVLIAASSLFLLVRYKINPVILIAAAILTGIIKILL